MKVSFKLRFLRKIYNNFLGYGSNFVQALRILKVNCWKTTVLKKRLLKYLQALSTCNLSATYTNFSSKPSSDFKTYVYLFQLIQGQIKSDYCTEGRGFNFHLFFPPHISFQSFIIHCSQSIYATANAVNIVCSLDIM